MPIVKKKRKWLRRALSEKSNVILGLRAIGRLLGYSQISIMKWVEQAGEKAKNQVVEAPTDQADVIEIDEMWHYVSRKKRNVGSG